MTTTPTSSLPPLNPPHETWKPIEALEGRYEISDHGNCRSLDTYDGWGRVHRGQPLKPLPDRRGYLRIRPSVRDKKSGHLLHRLVAQHFIPNPLNLPQVNHKDGVKTNNHVGNLEWVSNLDNMRHAVANGLVADRPLGKQAYRFKSAIKVFDATGKHVDTLVGNADMAAKGYDWRNVNACLYGTRKRHLGMTFQRDEPKNQS